MNLLVFRLWPPSALKLPGYVAALEGIELRFGLLGELLKSPPEGGNTCWGKAGGRHEFFQPRSWLRGEGFVALRLHVPSGFLG